MKLPQDPQTVQCFMEALCDNIRADFPMKRMASVVMHIHLGVQHFGCPSAKPVIAQKSSGVWQHSAKGRQGLARALYGLTSLSQEVIKPAEFSHQEALRSARALDALHSATDC